MDDTFVIQQAEHSQQFLQHINSIDPQIQFNTKFPSSDGSIPFLDTLVTPGPYNTLLTGVYRKPTHTDQHLHLNSHHSLSAKHNVFNTLTHCVRLLVSTDSYLIKRRNTSGVLYTDTSTPLGPLTDFKPTATIDTALTRPPNHHNNHLTIKQNNNNNNIYIMVPYTKGAY